MYMQEYTALYTSPSNNNSTGKPELTPIEEGAKKEKEGQARSGGTSTGIGKSCRVFMQFYYLRV